MSRQNHVFKTIQYILGQQKTTFKTFCVSPVVWREKKAFIPSLHLIVHSKGTIKIYFPPYFDRHTPHLATQRCLHK